MTIYQNMWDTHKAILRGKFIAYYTKYIKKEKQFQINNLSTYFEKTEKSIISFR